MLLPCFCPQPPEDSLFLPRCGHDVRSHFAVGAGKMGRLPMTIKANGRSALILAAGFLVCFAGPSQAAPASADNAAANAAASSKTENSAGAPMALSKYTKRSTHTWKSSAHRKSSKVALKSSGDQKPAATDVADSDTDNSSAAPTMPPSVANANARLASVDATPTGSAQAAQAMSARANDILQTAPDQTADTQPAADTQVVAADQLNDVDRALRESPPPAPAAPAPTLALASVEAPAAPAAPVVANSNESSTWDQTSLIGKIFIGFGALLTMASAARMFMA
jgi:hypothetical protein